MEFRADNGVHLDENGRVVKWENQAMSSEQLIPNAVGRLDDVVQAIRDGRIDDACTLLESEADRRHAKLESIKVELEKERNALIDVESFRFYLGATTIDRIDKLRVACGAGRR